MILKILKIKTKLNITQGNELFLQIRKIICEIHISYSINNDKN